MKKSAIQPLPEYFDRYINLVEDIELDEAFQISLQELERFDWESCHKLGNQTYAPGKWTIPDILQHLLDWERILTYRAILFVRETGVVAQGMDQDVLAKNAAEKPRSVADLVEEMKVLRQSTRLFFKSMDDADLQKTGQSWNSAMSVLALAFTILGHQRHHFKLLEERYLCLL